MIGALASLLLALWLGRPSAPAVTLYGAAGSFGGLAHETRLARGGGFSVHAVAGWRFLPGQAAYFTAVGPPGTVFIANEPQSDNQALPTARQMAISVFTRSPERFRNIVIATSTGVREVSRPWPSQSREVGGADVSDLAAISANGSARVAFISALPYAGWDLSRNGVYPTLGYLSEGARGWFYDSSRSVTALAIAGSAGTRTGQPCPPETSAGGRPFADCRLPTELAALPRSRDLVITQYAPVGGTPSARSGGLMVLDPRGRVRATYAYPTVTLPGGETVDVHPREVDADPVSLPGHERFVVIFDSTTSAGLGTRLGPFAMQEFGFDAATGVITPLSAPVLSGQRAPDGNRLGFETAIYDRAGNLWAAQSENGTITGGPLVVYRRAPDGSTLARGGCAVEPTWSGSGWGTPCAPSSVISGAAGLGIVRSLNQDPATRAMLVATSSGYLLPVMTGDHGRRLAPLAPIDLGLNRLANRRSVALDIRKGSIDTAAGTLYLPVQQLETSRQCRSYPCAPQSLDQWLYAVDLKQVVVNPTRQ
ncbi:MAG: hypothetical protein JO168_10165 [Solirubrobacterales bacterium]|nr:hypothetical protein [Solirubrobacterales bacterium]MBV9713840.1 hypothetical protein [Solirubrobacterales bacterium]